MFFSFRFKVCGLNRGRPVALLFREKRITPRSDIASSIFPRKGKGFRDGGRPRGESRKPASTRNHRRWAGGQEYSVLLHPSYVHTGGRRKAGCELSLCRRAVSASFQRAQHPRLRPATPSRGFRQNGHSLPIREGSFCFGRRRKLPCVSCSIGCAKILAATTLQPVAWPQSGKSSRNSAQ